MSGDFAAALQDTDEIDIAVTGRVSGRRIALPVWFIADDGPVWLLPVNGSDSNWYKNVLATPRLQVTAGGASIQAAATPVADHGRVQAVLEKFRDKYGADQVAAYYPKTDVAVELSVPAPVA